MIFKFATYELGSLRDLISNSEEPIQIQITKKFPIQSIELAVLIQCGLYHRDKFGELLKIYELPLNQINLFKILKITDILEIE